MNRITFVGAYERDNFGDYLLYRESLRYAEEAGFVANAAAPFAADMSEIFHLEVQQYSTIFSEKLTGCWVVGGEVGGVGLAEAAQVSDVSSVLIGLPSFASPYLPLLRDSAGRYAPLVLNSVGLAGLKSLRGVAMGYAVTAIRSARRISVREKASASVLRQLKIPHVLAPDVVHGIGDSPFLPAGENHGSVVLQMKGAWLYEYGISRAAELIASCDALRRRHIILFIAGTARGHDSVLGTRELAELLTSRHGMSVEVLDTFDPCEKVAVIRGASLWIGTSLHGLIISTAFGVPAIALQLAKLSTYVDSWGLAVPSRVRLEDLDKAIAYYSENERAKARHRDMGLKLAKLAQDSARETASTLLDALNCWDGPQGKWVLPSQTRLLMSAVAPMSRLAVSVKDNFEGSNSHE